MRNLEGGAPAVDPTGLQFTRRDVVIATAVAPAILSASLAEAASQSAAASHAALNSVPTRLTVNGAAHALDLDPRASLLDVLREQLGLTGCKKGCDHGQCGACTVPVRCIWMADALSPA